MIFQETAIFFTVVMLIHKDKVANPAFANSAEWRGERRGGSAATQKEKLNKNWSFWTEHPLGELGCPRVCLH